MSLLKPKLSLDISNRTIDTVVLRLLGWTLLLVMAVVMVQRIAHALTLVFVAFFLALALNPAVSRIMHYLPSKSRVRATAVAYVIVVGLLVAFFSLVTPPLIKQTVMFVEDVPEMIADFRTQDSALSRLVDRYDLNDQMAKIGNELASRVKDPEPLFTTAGRIGSTVASVIAVFILTFMMLVEGPSWLERFWQLQPAKERAKRQQLAKRMYRVITGYVNGQLILATIASCFALIVMFVLNVPNALALAGIVALFGLIPLIGNSLAAVVVVVVTLFTSVKLAIIMAIFFFVYMQIENATLQPYIQSRHNELTPLIVFVAALLGASFGGLLGAFIAIPAAGCCKILLDNYLESKHPLYKSLKEEDVANSQVNEE